jgi:hypothetical protein
MSRLRLGFGERNYLEEKVVPSIRSTDSELPEREDFYGIKQQEEEH